MYEILNVNFNDDDIYFETGKDNLKGLYRNLIELLMNDYGLRKLTNKIKSSNIKLDIVLNEFMSSR